MPNKKHSTVKFDAIKRVKGIEQDEVDEILTALRLLIQNVSSPVVKSCLEIARSDVVHLASTTNEYGDADRDENSDYDGSGAVKAA